VYSSYVGVNRSVVGKKNVPRLVWESGHGEWKRYLEVKHLYTGTTLAGFIDRSISNYEISSKRVREISSLVFMFPEWIDKKGRMSSKNV
jgi:hypothetical protein